MKKKAALTLLDLRIKEICVSAVRFCVAATCFLSILLTTSCTDAEGTYSEFKTVKNGSWNYKNVLTFNEKRDTLETAGDLVILTVQHTDDYAFANLWVELSYLHTDSLMSDTFNVFLADKYGKWLGSGTGPVVMHSDTLVLRNIPDTASFFLLRHIMRSDAVDNIEQIGLGFAPRTDVNQ